MPYQDPPQGASRYLSLPGVNKEKAMQWFSLGITEPQTYNQARLLAEAVGYSPEQSKVVAGQWQFESGGGSKIPSAYNYFGIKAHNEAVRSRLKERGLEVGVGKDAETAAGPAKFMEFNNAFEGFAAHKAFLETNKRYAKALAAPTAKDFAFGLSDAGYADKDYGNKLYNQYVAPKEKNPKSGDVRPKSFGPTRSSKIKPVAPVTTQGITGQDVVTAEEIQNLPLMAPQQIDFSTPVDKNPTQVKAMEDFEPYKQKVKPTESITFDAPKGWFGSGKTMFENGGAMNFKSKGAYQKWLGYGHASGEFAKTPGDQTIRIDDKLHKVEHQYGGQMYADGGALYDSMGNFYPDGGYANTVGQAAQYGSMGYQAGSQFGPWGGIIGGLAGTIIGGVQGNQQDQAIAEEEQKLADQQARQDFQVNQSGMAVNQEQTNQLNPNNPTIFMPSMQYAMGGNMYDIGGDLWKAASRNARVYVSPYSNEYSSIGAARKSKGASAINYNDPAFNLGYQKRIQLSRDPKFRTALGANVSLPYTGKMIPSIQGTFTGDYPLMRGDNSATEGTVRTKIAAGYDPDKHLNASIEANPRIEFSNIGKDKRVQDQYYKGDWSAYVGPTGGIGLQLEKGHNNPEFNASLLYGVGAGFQAQPFRSPLRVGADVHYGFQGNEGRGQDATAAAEAAGGRSGRLGLPSGRIYASYPLDKLGRDVKRQVSKIDWPEVEPLDITAPGFYLSKPEFGSWEQGESPKGFLPGYEPETGRTLSEQDVKQRYNYTAPAENKTFSIMENPTFKFGGRFNNSGFKALPPEVQAKIKSNSFAQGGTMDQLTEFNGGFKHDDPNILNSNSGIPQGMAPNGVPNIVERGETKDKEENYIFSDNIKVSKEIAQEFNLPSNYVNKTFSEASKTANRSHSRRENDTIESNDTKRNLEKLTAAQEATKELELQKDIAMMQQKHPDFMNTLMAQQQSYQPMGTPGGQMMEAQVPGEMMSGPQGMPIDPNQLPPEMLAQMPEAQQGMPVMAYGGHMYKCGGKMYNFGGRMYDNGGTVSTGGTTAVDGGDVLMIDNPADTSTPNLGAQMGGAAAGLAGTLGSGLTSGGSTEDALNSTVNQGLSMIPGYGAIHGVTNTAQQAIRSNLGDYNVNPITGEVSDTKTFKNEGEAFLDAWVKPQHEYITEGIAEGDWGKTAMATLLPGFSQIMQIQDSNTGPVNKSIVTPKVNTSGRAVNQIATEQMPPEEAPLYMKYGGYVAQSPNHEFQQITPMYKDNAGPQGQPLTNLYGMGGNMYSMGGRYLVNGGPGQPELAFIPPTTAQMEAEMYDDPYAQDFDWHGDWSPIMQEISDKEIAQRENDAKNAARDRILFNDSLFLPEIKEETTNEMRIRGIESPGEYNPQSFYPLQFLEEEEEDKGNKGSKGNKGKTSEEKDPRDLRTHETLASTVANILPGAYNLYQALQPLDNVTPEDLYTKYSPEKVNYTQAENEARENYARMVNAAGQLGLSGGSRMGSLLAAAQQYDKEKGRILSEEENINKQLENQARQMNAQQRTGAQKQAMDVNWKMRTARQEHVKELASMAKNYFDAERANEIAEKYVAMSAPDLIGEDKWQVGHQGYLEYLKAEKAKEKNKKA
jgi:hypothetical protein